MATRIGSVEYLVTADGRLFKRQLRQIGRVAGAESGAATGRAFDASFDKSMRGAGDSAFKRFRGKLSDMWQGLSQNARQWTLIIGAVLSGMQQLAVLSAAAGSGLLILGGAATAALVGLGGFIGAFALLAGDAEKVPESIKKAAAAFRELKTPLQEAQNLLAERAFAGTEVAFGKIGDAIRALTPSLGVLGDSVNRVVNSFADWVSSSDGVRLMSGLIEKSGPIFEKLLNVAGKLGKALLEAFNNPKFQKAIDDMLTGIGQVFDTFEAFTKSDDFGVWIENTTGILGDLGELIGGLSTMIDTLVTPEAYKRTSAFLDNLTESLPGITGLLEVLGELDPFGIIAEGLNTFMNALHPLWDVLEPIGAIVRDLLIGSFQQLGAILAFFAPILEVVRIGFEIAASALSKWLEYITPFQEAFTLLGGAFQQAGDTIWNLLAPAFDELWQAIIDLLPTAEEFTRWVNDYAIPAIETFAEWLGTEGAEAIKTFARWIRDEAVPQLKAFWEWLSTKVWPVVQKASENLGKAGAAFGIFVGAVKNALTILTAPIRYAIGLFQDLANAARIAIGASNGAKAAGSAFPKTANGGTFNGAQARIIGEAGPEAVVPLNRPLSRVDSSVRWLSAIAQGKSPAMGSGGVVGGGRTLNVQSGAIVVQEAGSALATGVEILDRLAARLA